MSTKAKHHQFFLQFCTLEVLKFSKKVILTDFLMYKKYMFHFKSLVQLQSTVKIVFDGIRKVSLIKQQIIFLDTHEQGFFL